VARFLGAHAFRKIAIISTSFIFLIISASPQRASDAAPAPQTERLEDLEQMALQNNPTAAQAEAAIRAAEGRRVQA
jgi:hypothetical protein